MSDDTVVTESAKVVYEIDQCVDSFDMYFRNMINHVSPKELLMLRASINTRMEDIISEGIE